MEQSLGLADKLKMIASQWRDVNPEYQCGVVLIWQAHCLISAYGWKDSLRDPQDEKPGAFAVDVDGCIFQAEGGNDYDGAKRWIQLDACDR